MIMQEPVSLYKKRLRAKLLNPPWYDEKNMTQFPQFLENLKTKLQINKAVISTEYDQIWDVFSWLESIAAERIYPWIN